eukprot:5789990-Pyramimonas_sp.AAC.1
MSFPSARSSLTHSAPLVLPKARARRTLHRLARGPVVSSVSHKKLPWSRTSTGPSNAPRPAPATCRAQTPPLPRSPSPRFLGWMGRAEETL